MRASDGEICQGAEPLTPKEKNSNNSIVGFSLGDKEISEKKNQSQSLKFRLIGSNYLCRGTNLVESIAPAHHSPRGPRSSPCHWGLFSLVKVTIIEHLL